MHYPSVKVTMKPNGKAAGVPLDQTLARNMLVYSTMEFLGENETPVRYVGEYKNGTMHVQAKGGVCCC